MPSPSRLVTNTSPLLALLAACGSLELLHSLYDEVLVPHEVCAEIAAGGPNGFGVADFNQAGWLRKWAAAVESNPYLRNALDPGEAAVIQLALDEGVQVVCIDEPMGRRRARLSGLSVTGSIGVLLRARKEGHLPSVRAALERMQAHGIWLSNTVITFALRESGEA